MAYYPTGGPHLYPELAAAGLWTAAPDLAKSLIEVQRSLAAPTHPVISFAMTRQMITHGLENWGLGLAVGEEVGHRYFWHGGARPKLIERSETFRLTHLGFTGIIWFSEVVRFRGLQGLGPSPVKPHDDIALIRHSLGSILPQKFLHNTHRQTTVGPFRQWLMAAEDTASSV